MLRIRRYQAPDADEVWRLHNLALHATGTHAGNGPWDGDLHHVQESYLAVGGEFLIGELHDRIVAMGALRPTEAGAAEVKRMRVHPDFQRRGFGSAMLRALEERARELGFTHLRLDTPEFNVGARRFYARHGYAECGVTEMPWFPMVLFEKHLPTDGAHAT